MKGWLVPGLLIGGALWMWWQAWKENEFMRRLREMWQEPEDGEDDDA